MEAAAQRPLALVPVLELAAKALGLTHGRHRVEFIFIDGQLVECWPHQEPGKLTRSQLDLVVLEPAA